MKVPSDVVRAIEAAQRVMLIAHVSPDGDAAGSLTGLGWALRKQGKRVTMVCQDPFPNQVAFLPGIDEVVSRPDHTVDLIVCLDSSDKERLGTIYHEKLFAAKPVLVIDHHVTNTRYGDVNWVGDAASTAELVTALVLALGIEIDPRIATCLLTGVVTDTRCFRTSNTTAQVLGTAQLLMEAGADLADITDRAFKGYRPARLHLWGEALSAVRIDDRIAWTAISLEMMAATGATEDEVNGLASFLETTDGVLASLVFCEKEGDRVECSMRAARGVNVSGVAFAMGGGGHPQAAGCTCKGSLEEVSTKVLAAIGDALREQGHTG